MVNVFYKFWYLNTQLLVDTLFGENLGSAALLEEVPH